MLDGVLGEKTSRGPKCTVLMKQQSPACENMPSTGRDFTGPLKNVGVRISFVVDLV